MTRARVKLGSKLGSQTRVIKLGSKSGKVGSSSGQARVGSKLGKVGSGHSPVYPNCVFLQQIWLNCFKLVYIKYL